MERKDQKLCERCQSWVPLDRKRCPNCLARLTIPAMPGPLQFGTDGRAFAAHVGTQLDGVNDPTERIARLLGVKSELELAIGAGSFGDPDEVGQARSYIGWVDQESEHYLVEIREANDRQAAKILGRGVKVFAAGLVLTVIGYLVTREESILYLFGALPAIGLFLIAVGTVLRVRPPQLPPPSRKPTSSP